MLLASSVHRVEYLCLDSDFSGGVVVTNTDTWSIRESWSYFGTDYR
jgi:hypothetical protein